MRAPSFAAVCAPRPSSSAELTHEHARDSPPRPTSPASTKARTSSSARSPLRSSPRSPALNQDEELDARTSSLLPRAAILATIISPTQGTRENQPPGTPFFLVRRATCTACGIPNHPHRRAASELAITAIAGVDPRRGGQSEDLELGAIAASRASPGAVAPRSQLRRDSGTRPDFLVGFAATHRAT
jgi:hypothetical protein